MTETSDVRHTSRMEPIIFDWRHPDYASIFMQRATRLQRIRANPDLLPGVKRYYKENIPQFISDWGMTTDPRLIERGMPANVPFLPFPKQVEWLEWTIDRWKASEPGLTEKSRDMGISWLAISLSCSLCLFYRNMAIGFGSRKEEYVDKLGDPKSLFVKARSFMQYLPPEFRGGWEIAKHSPHMRILFPETGSIIAGEAGDNIGRGDRKAIYFVDESAHLERPALVEASLVATTNCRQDMSSVVGMANPFAEKAHGGKIKKFTFNWQDDPRKDAAWRKNLEETVDPITIAQEYDINYTASVEGIVIPQNWVLAAVDAHVKLGIKPTGVRKAALDVADRGIDKNALAARHGILLERATVWSGKDSDIYATAEKAFNLCDTWGITQFDYDGDGLGASIRGDARKINELRASVKRKQVRVRMFRGSAAVMFPEQIVKGTDRKAEDFYANFKAQSWWSLRFRFQETWRAINGHAYDPDAIISIASDFPERARLCVELSQPVYKQNGAGKMLIDKDPDGVASPNLGDSVMIAFAPTRPVMNIGDGAIEALGGPDFPPAR